MQSLAATVPLLKWGPDDTIDAMFGRSLTYLVVFSTLGMIVSPFLDSWHLPCAKHPFKACYSEVTGY